MNIIAIGSKLNISPLDLLNADIDNFILLLNYFLSASNTSEATHQEAKPHKNDGFWDM